jgi:peptidoglycan/xylan/chitin deacetylase (PgdA/CDA1 family)
MTKPNVLIIADKEDVKFVDVNSRSEHWNNFWKMLDYNKLLELNEIQSSITKLNIDFVLYSRNDQVANRVSIGPVTKKLRVGYSSFSGIDEKNRIEQMKTCFEDFMECNKRLDFKAEKKQEKAIDSDVNRTFSLIFDCEQIGGARYGLPRIMNLLEKYKIRATFFVTNLIKKVYANVLEEISRGRHEIGIHGRWHEYLCNFDAEKQQELINKMKDDFGHQVYGANFIGRMNQNTLLALVKCGVEYCVYPQINYYRPFSYPKMPLNPYLINFTQGNLWMLPVSVETYNLPWLSIKNMIDSNISSSRNMHIQHISILLHPFRDGNLQHIHTTEKLIRYLSLERKLTAITLKEFADKASLHNINYKVAKIDQVETLSEYKPWRKILLPRTKHDLLGFWIENPLLAYRLMREGRATF